MRVVKGVVRNQDTIVQSAMLGFVQRLVLEFTLSDTSMKQGKLIDGILVR